MGCSALRVFLVVLIAVSGRAAAVVLDEPIRPISTVVVPQDPARTELGRRLFHEPLLSSDSSVSCASCHDLAKAGTDGRDRSVGIGGTLSAVNAPTVFNATLNFRQFWNGRADSLEAQIDAVIQNPEEMGSRWPDVLARLSQDEAYREAFATAYPDGVTRANVVDAIVAFERTLVTPNSRFDRYLKGDAGAITESEKAGYAKFKQYGCVACHQGVNVGGNMFQKFGILGDYFAKRGNPTPADEGRFLVTGNEADRHVFKVPSLRNVALTAPYFHDAAAKTLGDAVDVMFRYQLGRVASQEDKALIVEFLNTLTGELVAQPQ